MARKPNYGFERKERERMKEEKAERAAERKEVRQKKFGQSQPPVQSDC